VKFCETYFKLVNHFTYFTNFRHISQFFETKSTHGSRDVITAVPTGTGASKIAAFAAAWLGLHACVTLRNM
jgi:hypothetical protein